MTRLGTLALAALLGACGTRGDGFALLKPCPPGALPVCHAAAAGCAAPPFCYRTLGRVDCYFTAEASGRRTVEEVVPAPAGCLVRREEVVSWRGSAG